MKNFEFKSAICTSRSQSERLLKLGLKRETADMMYVSTEATCMGRPIPEEYRHYELILSPYTPPFGRYAIHIPAWSLHKLLILLNRSIEFEDWNLDEAYEHIIIWIEDAIRGGLFNKDYLEEKK